MESPIEVSGFGMARPEFGQLCDSSTGSLRAPLGLALPNESPPGRAQTQGTPPKKGLIRRLSMS